MEERERIKQVLREKISRCFEILKDLPGDSWERPLQEVRSRLKARIQKRARREHVREMVDLLRELTWDRIDRVLQAVEIKLQLRIRHNLK